MNTLISSLAIGFAVVAGGAVAQESQPAKERESKTTSATFLVGGLHCPPCTKTVETSLANVKGIRLVKVDWKKKTAKIEFDEKVIPAQKVAERIAATPHMMGGSMHYAGWLTLSAPEIKDKESAARAQEVLRKLPGVKTAGAYADKHSVTVGFAPKGELTTQQLIEALAKAGFQATASEQVKADAKASS